MQFRGKKMCEKCPFRPDSAPGYLGRSTPEEFVECIRQEALMPCHLQVEYADPDWEDQLDDVDHCVGALVFARKMGKLPRDAVHCKATLAVDMTQPCLSPQQFLEHHNGGPRSAGATRRRR